MESQWALASALTGRPRSGSSSLADSFEQLFRSHYTRVVTIANRILASRAEAEEVAQEVFLKFHQQHDADASYAAGWLYRASTHAALNRLRDNRRRTRREATNPLTPGGQDPEAMFEQLERRRQVREAMERLPEKSAAVLALRYSGLSYAEVAHSLGVSIGQVGTLLRRAEEKLRREMTQARGDDR